jgi:hypothetical protein
MDSLNKKFLNEQHIFFLFQIQLHVSEPLKNHEI